MILEASLAQVEVLVEREGGAGRGGAAAPSGRGGPAQGGRGSQGGQGGRQGGRQRLGAQDGTGRGSGPRGDRTDRADRRPAEAARPEGGGVGPDAGAARMEADRTDGAVAPVGASGYNGGGGTNGVGVNGVGWVGVSGAGGVGPNGVGAKGAPGMNGAGAAGMNGGGPGGGPGGGRNGGTCTGPQLKRFIKSRVYVPMHELRRRFLIDGNDDDVTPVSVGADRIYVGLPEREGRLLGELLRGGDVGYELSMDPPTPIVVGVYPMRPISRG